MHSDGFGEVTDTDITPAPTLAPWGDDPPRPSRSQPRHRDAYAGDDDEPTKTLHRAHIAPVLVRAASIPPLPNLGPRDDDPTTDYMSPTVGFLQRAPARPYAGAPSPFPPAPAGHGSDPAAPRVSRSSGIRESGGARPRRDSVPGRASSEPASGLPAGVTAAQTQRQRPIRSSKLLGAAPPAAVEPPPSASASLQRTAPLSPPLTAAIRIANEARVREALEELERAETSLGTASPPAQPAVAAVPRPLALRQRLALSASPTLRPPALPQRSAAIPAVPVAPPAAGFSYADPPTPPTEEYVPAHAVSVQSQVVETRFDAEQAPGRIAHVFTKVRSWRLAWGTRSRTAAVIPTPDRRWLVVAAAVGFGLCAACTAAWMLTHTPQATAALETGPSEVEVARILQARTGFIVSTYPSGARIHVDGRETGRFAPERVTGLTPGLHSIELKLAGYYDTNLPAVLEEGATLVLPPIELRPLPPSPPTEDP
jgi:hypothetical protein